jgi:hypothetical protein
MIETIINDINYRLDEDNLTAEVMENEGYEGDIIIPETVVSNGATYRVTSIRQHAFRKCTSLTSITLPDSIATIARGAFNGCSSLTAIVIPDSVTSIGHKAFAGCTSLKLEPTQEIEMSNFKYRLLMHNHLAMVVDCYGEPEAIDVPSEIHHEGVIYRVTSIGDFAFNVCSSLRAITIPDGVISIEYRAFFGCQALTNITIPNSVTSIGTEAFYDCSSLTSIVLPNSLKSIEWWAFCRCESLTDITFQGTIAQWNKIKLRENWKDEVPATVVHCTDGDVEI